MGDVFQFLSRPRNALLALALATGCVDRSGDYDPSDSSSSSTQGMTDTMNTTQQTDTLTTGDAERPKRPETGAYADCSMGKSCGGQQYWKIGKGEKCVCALNCDGPNDTSCPILEGVLAVPNCTPAKKKNGDIEFGCNLSFTSDQECPADMECSNFGTCL